MIERSIAGALICFAVFFAASALIAAMLPGGAGRATLAEYRTILALGLPPCAMGLGLACIFLIAADLAGQLRALAATDPLTGVFNRRGLEQATVPLLAVCRRQGQPLSIALADLDRFKAVNDRFGHGVGDEVLRRFAAHVARTLRRGDLFARLGGEEFAFVLPNTGPEQARDAIERLRAGLSEIAADAIAPLLLTASFGIAMVAPGETGIAEALDRADRALYASKQKGRDRVTLAPADRSHAMAGS
jgi:diguanylate cyclase (GGDEF)-like protein